MTDADHIRLLAERGRVLVEESREVVIVLDADDRLVAASRRARESLPELEPGVRVPAELLENRVAIVVPYDAGGRAERLVYLPASGELAAYEELRTGFTAAVSHELRTPLARLLTLLESSELPGADVPALLEQARAEVGEIRELIDDVLFLSELESGREVVALGSTPVVPVLEQVARRLRERADRADVRLVVEGDPTLAAPLRPRMLRMLAENLTENAIRYAGPRTSLTLTAKSEDGALVLSARDDGVGVSEEDLPRLFERFYRGDRARTSRGTGLGLAIVKHLVAAAGGTVDATVPEGGGLEIRARFP
ncbi:MAG: two-component system, OmpR family, phosphate regulon sensor histidine kinase PhoR [Gaiellaceae bacterium]|jgi:two-component system phosphate regulon sensor histidine kinase PhoR|nr:two-component system, OmpR family, phosphate regulon sensor histidine kinase PhoR [Gaiellaceae bacterium]